MKKYRWRSLISICLILAVFVAPLLSESRYRSYLNSFVAVIAKEYYFSSNYLKEGGASYLINGWDGATVSMDDIQIRNYDNTLLANQDGQDLNYLLTWDVKVYNEGKQDITATYPYTLEITYKEDESTFVGEETRTPDIDHTKKTVGCTIVGDGNSKRDTYGLRLVAPSLPEGTPALANNSYAIVTLTATNVNDRNQYSRTITSRIRYNVSMLEQFIRTFLVTDDGKQTVTTEIATNTIPGTGNIQKIYLWWDLAVLAVDQFNHQFDQLFLAGKYQELSNNDKTRTFGVLEISASSLSSRVFQHEKVQSGIRITDDNVLQGGSYLNATATQYIGYYLQDTEG